MSIYQKFENKYAHLNGAKLSLDEYNNVKAMIENDIDMLPHMKFANNKDSEDTRLFLEQLLPYIKTLLVEDEKPKKSSFDESHLSQSKFSNPKKVKPNVSGNLSSAKRHYSAKKNLKKPNTAKQTSVRRPSGQRHSRILISPERQNVKLDDYTKKAKPQAKVQPQQRAQPRNYMRGTTEIVEVSSNEIQQKSPLITHRLKNNYVQGNKYGDYELNDGTLSRAVIKSPRRENQKPIVVYEIVRENECSFSAERPDLQFTYSTSKRLLPKAFAQQIKKDFESLYASNDLFFNKQDFCNRLINVVNVRRGTNIESEDDVVLDILTDAYNLDPSVDADFFRDTSDYFIKLHTSLMNQKRFTNAIKCITMLFAYFYVYSPYLFNISKFNIYSLRVLVKLCNKYCLLLDLSKPESLKSDFKYLVQKGYKLTHEDYLAVKENQNNHYLYKLLLNR